MAAPKDMNKFVECPSPRDNHIIETECITYLNECFNRLYNDNVKSLVDNDSYKQVKDLIIRNICTALKQPGLYESQNLNVQIIELFKSCQYSVEQFTTLFSHIVADFIQTEDPAEVDSLLLSAFQPLLNQVSKDFRSASLLLLPMHHFDLLLCFASIEKLATTLIRVSQVKHSNENEPPPGYLFEETLFGSMLNISCLPKHHQIHAPMSVFNEFFSKPHEYTPSILQTIEGKIWFGLDNLLNNAHKIFHTILKTKNIAVRNQLLVWIGDCLNSNAKRGKLWTTVNVDITAQLMNISDAMAFNLTGVLLKLSKPIVTSEEKYVKIDPTYCAHEDDATASEMGIHLRGLHKETCLLPHDAEAPRPKPRAPLTFITECYWLTHRSLDLSTRVMLDQLNRTHQELARIQATYLDAMNNPDHPMTQHVREALSLKTSKYIAYRTVLLHPTTLSLLTQFQLCTCVYLVQLLLNVDQSESSDSTVTSHAPLMMRPVSFPLPEKITPVLKCIPEFVIDNLWSFLYLIRHHKVYHLEEAGTPLLEPSLTCVLAYMGTNRRIRNPHLRARLAELFTEHPHRVHIVRSLLDIFVGIEMTGESVEFEQKFNYRRPMYAIMRFLWSLDEHRRQFVRLARVAEENMHSDRPPLFLRFINLLMNDAVFLLDEALSNMAQIRTMQTAQENGEWAALPPREQAQNQGFLQHIGMMARFDNILGNETIHTLEYLTSEIRSIFCHSTMVDRIAAMLNYFLFHLVGPKMRNFKVKDMQEYKFAPATIVLNICKMYVHLGSNEQFCAAVSQDGRSYSPQLFTLAEGVLARIGGASLIPDLRRVAALVEKLGAQLQSDEALLAGAPDEYLDPIMNTIMLEPTDPFNRSPLTMEQVIPNTQLQTQIQDWIRQCRQKSLASKSADTTSKSGETESESAQSPDHSASQTSSSEGREIQSESEAASKPEDTQSQSALAADPNSVPPSSSASDESK
ncbi:hypothetical protein M8J75_003871 [Diaphorina citri]|nr:hypothetical protein M8J75_003871 [Diaphorina citri]